MTESLLLTGADDESGLAFPKPTPEPPEERQRLKAESDSEFARNDRDAMRRVKAMARQRDGFRCRFCSERGYEVAHGFGEGAYPQLRFIGINLFTSCRRCHALGHQHPTRWRRSIEILLGADDFGKLERASRHAGDGPRPEDVIAAAKRGEFWELSA